MAVIGGSSRWVGRYSIHRLRHYALIGRERVLEGGLWALAAYVIATGLVFTFVQISVNKHSAAHLEEYELPVRTMSWLNNWATYGFARYAGLLIYSSDGLSVYKSHSGFHLWPLYAIEVVTRAIRGRFSYRLAALFNQSVIWIGAALVGWLGMRLTTAAPRSRAFLLGLGCAVVYQTFPLNLMNFWYLNPVGFAINAMIAFWLAESYARYEPANRWAPIATAASIVVLALSYSLSLTLFFVAAYVAVELFVDGSDISFRHVMLYVVAPVVAVALFEAAQVAWVQLTIANVHFTGNLNFGDFLWRSGFDGSTYFYVDHWSLLTRRQLSTTYPGRDPALILQWKWLFIGGVTAVTVIAARYIRTSVVGARMRVVFLATSLTCYALSAFVFSQGVTIHPDIWDVLLAWPLIIAFFCFLPADLEVVTNRTGLAILIWLVVAVCYVMVQLRTYAAAVSLS
jgi:hypothetical protein